MIDAEESVYTQTKKRLSRKLLLATAAAGRGIPVVINAK
jgi:hypothetical protein